MQVSVEDGGFSAFVVEPGVTPAPVVLVLQEIFGVNQDIRQTCTDLALMGFFAMAPDLFWRASPGLDLDPRQEGSWQQGLALYRDYDFDRGVRDIAATIAIARALPGSTGMVGAIGFCLGGLMAYLAAARTDLDSAVSYYGGGMDAHLDEADAITAPLLIHLGTNDEYISRPAQQQIAAALGSRPNVQIRSYTGASHAFARHAGAHHDPVAAALANGRTQRFLHQTLARP